jgi:transposase, IS30 family
MPRYAPNKMPSPVKRRYFQLIRQGYKGAAAARMVGVSTSCGSLWFIDAGSVAQPDRPISPRFLTQDDRIAIADGLHAGDAVKVIAARLGKGYQSVYREIARNSKPDGGYQPWWAHNRAFQQRQRPKPAKLDVSPQLRRLVLAKLALRWSPQQISRYLHRTYPDDASMRLSAEAIYQGLFAGRLGKKQGKLRTGRVVRRRQRRGVAPPNKIKNMRLISHRPAEVRDRAIAGHWEGDLIIGKYGSVRGPSAIGTLVERTSRYLVLVQLPQGYKAPQMCDALIAACAGIPPALRKTLTWDQGREMAMHEQTEAATGWRIYFCDPHSPWQRPTNENTNGLLRQYFPKHTDLSVHSSRDLHAVARQLNQRPRIVLGDRTPEEVMRSLVTTRNTS